MRHILIIITTAFLIMTGSTGALERFTTTASLMRGAKYIAHVRIESSRPWRNNPRLREYSLIVLESFKGKLPGRILVRIPHYSRIVDPDRHIDPDGSEWIVILGNRSARGIYPLRSLHWGKIEIMEHPSNGKKMLARPLTGFRRDGRAGFKSLSDFRGLARKSSHSK